MQPVISEAGINKCILNVNQYFILTWVQIHNFCHNVTDGYSCIMMILISVFSNGSMNIVGIYCCAHLHSCWRRMLSHVYPSYWSIEYVIFYVTCLYRVGPHVQLLFTTQLKSFVYTKQCFNLICRHGSLKKEPKKPSKKQETNPSD